MEKPHLEEYLTSLTKEGRKHKNDSTEQTKTVEELLKNPSVVFTLKLSGYEKDDYPSTRLLKEKGNAT